LRNRLAFEAQIIGYVEANEGKKVTVQSEFGEFVYE
jgi:phosphoribosylformylglycinamidine cyclo-ligase